MDKSLSSTSAAELKQLLEVHYELTNVELSLIRVGGDGNQTYRVMAGQSPLIARIYGEQGRKNPDWVRCELELVSHLVKGGVFAAAPLAARDGSLVQFLPLKNGDESDEFNGPPAPAAVFTFAEGGVEWPTSPSRSHVLGSAFAQLHLVANSFHSTAEGRVLDVDRLIHAPLTRIRPYLNDSDPDDRAAWEVLTETAEQAAVLLNAVPDTDGAFGPIHGDLHQGNCHFSSTDNRDQLTFFDFSNAGTGWRVYDLSGFLWPMRDDTIREPKIRAACDAFLEGYRNTRRLLPEEEVAVAASIKARDFWETGCWLEFGQNLDPNTVRTSLHAMADQFRRFPIAVQ